VATFPPGKGGLSPAEVDELVGAIDESKMGQGRIGPRRGEHLVSSIRSGTVQWIGTHDVSEAIFSHLYTLAVVTNREMAWEFDIRGVAPMIQATRYATDGNQHYSWHMDWGIGANQRRKIAVVAHLSDESEFDGGNLQLTIGSRPVNANQSRGTVTVFPSFLLHQVTPVERGVRLGAVLWVMGPPFR
jgi:PKHD-type hydroxylase